MLERTMRIMTENLARSLDRRVFLKRTGQAMFMGVAALAAGQLKPALAAAGMGNEKAPMTPSCAPPGPYCNLDGVNEPNGCHGASCFQHLISGTVYQCHVYYIYPGGCWTTAATGGYWTCCDCRCSDTSQTTCGCAQFSGTPAPRPDSPGGKAVG